MMCLSNVYRDDEENSFLFRNIASVETDGDELVFTDLFGARNTIRGSIVRIDLIENTILIKEPTIIKSIEN